MSPPRPKREDSKPNLDREIRNITTSPKILSQCKSEKLSRLQKALSQGRLSKATMRRLNVETGYVENMKMPKKFRAKTEIPWMYSGSPTSLFST